MASRALRVFRAASTAARAVPRPVAEGVAGAVAAVVIPRIASDRRAQVERNLRRVHGPSFDGADLRRAVGATFASYARYWVESFRLPGTSPDDLEAGIVVDDWDLVEDALDAGSGAILALPHLGAWEWAGFWVATVRKRPITVVVEALEPPDVYGWFVALRESFGMHVVPVGPHAASRVLAALRDNHVVCLLSDRDLTGGGVEVEFFGEATTLPGGPATLALRSGAPLFPTAVFHGGERGRQGIVRPALDTTRSGARLRDDVARITRDLAAELEDLVRLAPEQWHLLQPNWPSDR